MSQRACTAVLGAAILLAGTWSPAATVASGSLKVSFTPPKGWVAAASRPEGLLALFRPVGSTAFPHLAVTDGEGGEPEEVLLRVRRSVPALFEDLELRGARLLEPPRLEVTPAPARVEFAYSGELGDAACDWHLIVVPGPKTGLVFTFALPRGSLGDWKETLETFSQSLRRSP